MRIFIRKLVASRSTAHQIAFGAAIGMFIGWTPTVGLQMILAIPLCLLLRANPVAAIPPIWLTNPVTVVPVYSFNYWIGRILIGGPTLREFRADMHQVFTTLESGALLDSVKELLVIGREVFMPLVLGSCLVGLFLALALYGLTFVAVKQIRSKLAERKKGA